MLFNHLPTRKAKPLKIAHPFAMEKSTSQANRYEFIMHAS